MGRRPGGDVGLELETLKALLTRRAPKDGVFGTSIEALSVFRHGEPDKKPRAAMYAPGVCVSVQGAKRVVLGDESYVYEPGGFLITSVHLPTVVQVLRATPRQPFLGLMIRLDPREVSELLLDAKLPPPRSPRAERGMAVGRASMELLSAINRLVRLLDAPQDIPILAPVIRREITFRLLTSDQGERLRQVALAGSQGQQIAQAIEWLKSQYAQPLRIEELAGRVHMSVSAFHQHFKNVTAMSPLQFQKWLRLNEARRLMLTQDLNAGTAALQVGYESPSQFSREYRRLFEQSPLQDIKLLRRAPRLATA